MLASELQLELFSIDGKLAATISENLSGDKMSFDVDELKPGIYLGALYNRHNRVGTFKFIKAE